LDDPGEKEACVFSIKDKIVYKGESAENPAKKWMYIVKNEKMIEIANMKPTREMLWSAEFSESKPHIQQHLKKTGGLASLVLPPFILEGFGQMQEPEDRVYFEKAGREFQDGLWAISKFSLQTTVTCTPGSRRGENDDPFQLFVFARGTLICDYERANDNKQGGWKKNIAEFVDAICFNLVQLNTGENIASWWVPGDLHHGKGEQQNALFHLIGDWFSKTPIIRTSQGWDPILALLVAYICASEFSPSQIKSYIEPDFPDRPPNASFF